MKRLLTAPALPLMFAFIPLIAAGSLRAEGRGASEGVPFAGAGFVPATASR